MNYTGIVCFGKPSYKYEKPDEKVVSHVSAILHPNRISKVQAEQKDKVTINDGEFNLEKNSSFWRFWVL